MSTSFEVERIVTDKILRNERLWMVKWVGYGDVDNTWEPKSILESLEIWKLYEQYRLLKELKDCESHEIICKYIVSAYIAMNGRMYNKIIPINIIPIIAMFYKYKPIFYSTQYGEYLRFPNGITVKSKRKKYGICLFGSIITNNMCNKYDIHIKIISLYSGFCVGYVASTDCIKNWNESLGTQQNKNSSTGFWLYVDNDQFMQLCDIENYYETLDYLKQTNVDNGDVVILSFNFLTNYIEIYINNFMIQQISLNKKPSIIPAFSLWDENDSIKIIKCECH